MGRNSSRNKTITKMYLPRLKKYCEELEKQLEALKSDPQTTLGQVINQARELYTQNSRLSVLTAALLEAQGNKVTVSKAAMDKFENHRVLIKWELPEGVEKAEDAKEFVFMYEAVKNQVPMQPIQVGPMTHASVPITAQAIEGTAPLAVEAECTCPDYPNTMSKTCPDHGLDGDPSVADPESDGSNENEAQAVDPEIISSAMQGVDCPYCEDGTEHKHSEEDVAHLRSLLNEPTPQS